MPHLFGSWSSCIHANCLLPLPIVAPQQLQARLLNPIPKHPATGAERESRNAWFASQGETRNNHLLVSQLHSHFFLGLKQLHSKRSPQRTSIAFLGPRFDENSGRVPMPRCHLKDYLSSSHQPGLVQPQFFNVLHRILAYFAIQKCNIPVNLPYSRGSHPPPTCSQRSCIFLNVLLVVLPLKGLGPPVILLAHGKPYSETRTRRPPLSKVKPMNFHLCEMEGVINSGTQMSNPNDIPLY